jgi:hypothetical protein
MALNQLVNAPIILFATAKVAISHDIAKHFAKKIFFFCALVRDM